MLLHPLADGFRLEAPGPDVAVLLHGWTGSPAHLRMLGAELHGAGLTVVAPRLAGHGTSLEDMAATGWRDWLRSAALPVIEALDDGARVHLVGLSMGGVLSLLIAGRREIATVSVINTPYRFHRRAPRAQAWFGRLRRFHRWEPEPAPAGEGADLWHQYAGAPSAAATDLLLLIRAMRRVLPTVTAPLLIVQSRADATVRPDSAEHLLDRAGSSDKRILWLERSRHVSTVDVERHRIHDAVIEHITRHGSGPSPRAASSPDR